MGEAAIHIGNRAHHVIENAMQFFCCEGEQPQTVVESQNGTDVVAGDGSGRKAGAQFRITRCSVRMTNTVLINAADGIADTAAILDRHQHAVVKTARVMKVGIGGEVAGVGLLSADAVRIAGLTGAGTVVAVQIHIGVAIGREGVLGDLTPRIVNDLGDIGLRINFSTHFFNTRSIRGVAAGNLRVVRGRDEIAVVVEVDHQAPDVAVITGFGDHSGLGATGIGDELRIGIGSGVTRTRTVVVVEGADLRAAGDHDVDILEALSQPLFHPEHLAMAGENDLVDPIGNQSIHLGLDHCRQRIDLLIREALIRGGRGDHRATGAGDAGQTWCRGTHHTDALTVLLKDNR